MDELSRSCHYVRKWNHGYRTKFIRHLWARGNNISVLYERGTLLDCIELRDNPIRDIPEIYKSRDYKLKFKATVRGIDYEIEKSEYRDFIQWYFNWKPERILKKIEADEGQNPHKECRHPHIHKYLYWIANKVSSVDTSAKRKFDRFIQESIANFQRRWQTEIVP